ncbi:MAG TPA: glycosyltransferase [Humibacillus xanthopallidus]|nr:glycosyltransferase [Humibacillus xanthopallidus]
MSAYAVVGPDRHGVVIHALRLAASSPGLGAALVRIDAPGVVTAATELRRALARHDRAMIHVTDHLLGATAHDAADLVEELSRSTSLALCLHDIPQPEEGEARYDRRRAAYRRFVDSASVVVVASEHERALLARCLDGHETSTRVVVLPLPVERVDTPAPERHSPRVEPAQVAVLGFLYPGKGLEHVIDAAGLVVARGREVEVVNVGGVSTGHASLVEELALRALQTGTTFAVTGYVPEADLAHVLRAVDVPVAAHLHVSASGSINTWISLGRRPIVLAGAYTRELAARLPGAVTVVDDVEALAPAIERALESPDSTWVGDDVELGPSWAESAEAHEAVLRSIS